MSLSHRKKLLSAVIATLLASAPVCAMAQPDEEDVATDDAVDAEEAADADDADEAPDPDADMPDDDEDTGTSAAEPEDNPDNSWGVGGVEEEGRFKPRGKTGKLKELEGEEEEEAEDATPPDLPPPGFAYMDAAFAFGDMVIVGQTATGGTDITPTASFVIGLGYMIADQWQISARFPFSTGDSDGPIQPFLPGGRNPDAYTQIATGNLELAFSPHFQLNRHIRMPLGLAIALPTGQGDMFPNFDERAKLGQAIVNQAAAASRGWEDRALFAYNRFGITPSGGMLYSDEVGPGTLHLGADMKFEIMARTGGNDAPPETGQEGQGEVKDASFNWVTRGSVFYDFFDGMLSPGVKLWFAFATAHEVRESIDPGGAQFVFEPNIATHLPFTDENNIGVDARLGYMIPLGGELGGDNASTNGASIGGLRLTAGLFFGP